MALALSEVPEWMYVDNLVHELLVSSEWEEVDKPEVLRPLAAVATQPIVRRADIVGVDERVNSLLDLVFTDPLAGEMIAVQCTTWDAAVVSGTPDSTRAMDRVKEVMGRQLIREYRRKKVVPGWTAGDESTQRNSDRLEKDINDTWESETRQGSWEVKFRVPADSAAGISIRQLESTFKISANDIPFAVTVTFPSKTRSGPLLSLTDNIRHIFDCVEKAKSHLVGELKEARGKRDDVPNTSEKQEPSIMVLGEGSTGKSTFINNLAGIEILPVGEGRVTSLPTIISLNEDPSITSHCYCGHKKEVDLQQNSSQWSDPFPATSESLKQEQAREDSPYDYLNVKLCATLLRDAAPESPILRGFQIIDFPGLGTSIPESQTNSSPTTQHGNQSSSLTSDKHWSIALDWAETVWSCVYLLRDQVGPADEAAIKILSQKVKLLFIRTRADQSINNWITENPTGKDRNLQLQGLLNALAVSLHEKCNIPRPRVIASAMKGESREVREINRALYAVLSKELGDQMAEYFKFGYLSVVTQYALGEVEWNAVAEFLKKKAARLPKYPRIFLKLVSNIFSRTKPFHSDIRVTALATELIRRARPRPVPIVNGVAAACGHGWSGYDEWVKYDTRVIHFSTLAVQFCEAPDVRLEYVGGLSEEEFPTPGFVWVPRTFSPREGSDIEKEFAWPLFGFVKDGPPYKLEDAVREAMGTQADRRGWTKQAKDSIDHAKKIYRDKRDLFVDNANLLEEDFVEIIASGVMYTMENSRGTSLYKALNDAIRSEDRNEELVVYKAYLKLLLLLYEVMKPLPQGTVIYRGVGRELTPISKHFEDKSDFQWYSFGSCTTSLPKAREFMNQNTPPGAMRTLFKIRMTGECSIHLKQLSLFLSEEEVLLPPCSRFVFEKVDGYKVNGDTIEVNLVQVAPKVKVLKVETLFN